MAQLLNVNRVNIMKVEMKAIANVVKQAYAMNDETSLKSQISQLVKAWNAKDPKAIKSALYYFCVNLEPVVKHARKSGTLTNEMEKAYIDSMPEIVIGPIREALFYLKMSEAMFKHYNIEAVYTSWSPTMDLFYNYYVTDSYLFPKPHFFKYFAGKSDRSGICYHPNERGYQIWADFITDALKIHHPNFLKDSLPGEFEWEWLGDIKYEMKYRPWRTII